MKKRLLQKCVIVMLAAGLVSVLAGCPATPVVLNVTPTADQTAVGVRGGTLTPSSFTFDVNATGGSAQWTANSNATWLSVQPLAGKGAGTVTATLTTQANDLAPGTYSATVWIAATGDLEARTIVLTVKPDRFACVTRSFETSLHGTRNGKLTWYEGTPEEPGFFSLTGIPYEELGCRNCHAATYANGTPVNAATYEPGCADCHTDSEEPSRFNVASQTQCFSCHGRQGAEINMSNSPNPVVAARFADVHRSAGMGCTDCHMWSEFHGDDVEYASIMETDSPTCEACHTGTPGMAEAPDPTIREHAQHIDQIECAVCHAQTVVSCYNCHFETEVQKDFKRFFGPPPFSGFVLMVNKTSSGKISTASFQSVTYQGKKFVAIGPYHGHTITAEGRKCGACHDNPNMREYRETGQLRIATWNEQAKTVTPIQGAVPIPPDYKTALKFDFLTYTAADLSPTVPAFQPNLWTLVPGDADLIQMLPEYVTPLSIGQMMMLQLPMPEE